MTKIISTSVKDEYNTFVLVVENNNKARIVYEIPPGFFFRGLWTETTGTNQFTEPVLVEAVDEHKKTYWNQELIQRFKTEEAEKHLSEALGHTDESLQASMDLENILQDILKNL